MMKLMLKLLQEKKMLKLKTYIIKKMLLKLVLMLNFVSIFKKFKKILKLKIKF